MSWIKPVSEYVFGKTPIERYSKNRDMIDFAVHVLTTHGMNGKMMEGLIQHRYGIIDDGEIHGHDGTLDGRNVEIKTQRTGGNQALNCRGDFSDHRVDTELKSTKYLRDLPILFSVGVDSQSAKCIYVVTTDFAKIPKGSEIFERLSAKAPRINFKHFRDFPDSYEVVYKNDGLLERAIRLKEINGKLGNYLRQAYCENKKNIPKKMHSLNSACSKPSSLELFFKT